jgi:hypothetical protein
LGTGTKVAIGCGLAAVVGGVVLAAVVFGGLWWAKGKAEQFTGHEAKIEELKKKANAVPFTEPADGVIREDRLVKFLDIRRRVFDVFMVQQVYKTLWASEVAKASPGPEGGASAPTLDVPPANLALFREHETEIKQYAMGGLEWVGL